MEAQDTIRRLEDQLRQVQAAKQDYEMKQLELQKMMERLQDEKHMESDAKAKLEQEIQSKAEEVENIKRVVEEKDAETKKLQEEVEEARRKQQEVRSLKPPINFISRTNLIIARLRVKISNVFPLSCSLLGGCCFDCGVIYARSSSCG